MRTILLTLALFLSSCAASPQTHLESPATTRQSPSTQKQSGTLVGHQTARKMAFRVTAYWGGDKWTKKGLSSTGKRLVSGKSAAIDSRIVPYFSKLTFFTESGKKEVLAVDTGSAVRSRLASRKTGKNHPVIDIFFNSRSAAQSFLKTLPKNQIVEVIIQSNSTKVPKEVAARQ